MLEIVLLVGVFTFGFFFGYVMRVYLVRHMGYAGQILITETEEKKIFSLELNGDPEDLADHDEVIFRVVEHPLVKGDSSH